MHCGPVGARCYVARMLAALSEPSEASPGANLAAELNSARLDSITACEHLAALCRAEGVPRALLIKAANAAVQAAGRLAGFATLAP